MKICDQYLKETLLSDLEALKTMDDTEERHIEADKCLLRFINDMEIRDKFDELKKWYS